MENKPTSSFIKRIDHYLLKNFPVTWSSRIHSAGVYAIAFSLLIALLCFIAPNDPRNNTTIYYWIVLNSILSLLGFIFWMIYLLRFNVFKRFGKWSNMDTLKSFIFYFIITLLIISWPFIPPVIESVRANMKFTSEELATDINNMNIKICQLEQDSINKRFRRDTFEVSYNVRGYEKATNRRGPQNDINDYSEPDNYYLIDTSTLKQKLNEADSVQKLTNTVYVIYDCPDYTFVKNYSVDEHSKVKLLSDMDLYYLVFQNKQSIDIAKVRMELGQLFRKYSPEHDPTTLSSGYETYDRYGEKSYISKINDKYDLYQIDDRIGNIAGKKYRWEGETIGISWRLLYYFTLCLSTLVLIYRHTTRRTFFLSLLSAVVLTILTSIFIAMGPHHGNDNSFYLWTIAYFILFGVLSAFIFYSRNRTVVSGIGLNLLVLMTPFMPLIITGLYYKTLHERSLYSIDEIKYANAFKNEDYNFFLSEIGGGVLLIILLATLYQMAFKKWFSLPEQ